MKSTRKMLLLLQHLTLYMCNITPQKQTLKWNAIHKACWLANGNIIRLTNVLHFIQMHFIIHETDCTYFQTIDLEKILMFV